MSAMSWEADLAPVHRRPGAERQWAGAVWLAGVLVSLGVASWLCWGQLASGALLPLETVRFNGELSRVSEADLQRAVEPHVEGGWLAADVQPIRRAVESLPWVQAAAVRRVWPDALRVTITQHEPLARWGTEALISSRGELFSPASRPADLPALAGPQGSADRVLSTYRTLRSLLNRVGLELTELRLDERRSWRGRLAAGTELVIGRDAPVDRVARLVAAWPRLDRRGPTAQRVDLRYPNGFAIRWQSNGGDDTKAPEGRTDES